jgi:hypothetical protein
MPAGHSAGAGYHDVADPKRLRLQGRQLQLADIRLCVAQE